MSELPFRLIFLGYYLALIGISVYFRRRANRQGLNAQEDTETRQREGKVRVFRRVAGIFMVSAALLYIFYPPFMDALAAPLPLWLRWIGVGIAVVSLPLLAWVQDALGKQWSRNLQLQAEHQLITTGPYRLVRHPMYTVIFMAMSSIAIISANWLMIVPALGAMMAIYSRIGNEESMLREAFPGEYEAYMRRTGRFLPRLRS